MSVVFIKMKFKEVILSIVIIVFVGYLYFLDVGNRENLEDLRGQIEELEGRNSTEVTNINIVYEYSTSAPSFDGMMDRIEDLENQFNFSEVEEENVSEPIRETFGSIFDYIGNNSLELIDVEFVENG